jgi:hypothetical protein
MQKKGVEMSLSFLVMVILSITIVILGSVLVVNISNRALELDDSTEGNLEKRFAELNCAPNEGVCIGVIKRVIDRGQSGVFEIKIINHFNSTIFRLNVQPSTSYNKSDGLIDNNLDISYNSDNFIVEKIEEKELGVGITVPKNATLGTYVFDLSVTNKINGQFVDYGSKHRIYVIVH